LGILRSRLRLLWVYKFFPRFCGNSTFLSTSSLQTYISVCPRCRSPFLWGPLVQTPL